MMQIRQKTEQTIEPILKNARRGKEMMDDHLWIKEWDRGVVLLGVSGGVVALLISVYSVLASTTTRSFPVHVPFLDWPTFPAEVTAYTEALMWRTGGSGLGAAWVFALYFIPLFFVCWCPHCCVNPKHRNKRSNCFLARPDMPPSRTEKWTLALFLVVVLCGVVVCTIFMGVYAARAIDDVDTVFASVYDSIDRVADFVCGGPLQEMLENNTSLSLHQLEDAAAGMSVDQRCQDSSWGGYTYSIDMRLGRVMQEVVTFVDDLHQVKNITFETLLAAEKVNRDTAELVNATARVLQRIAEVNAWLDQIDVMRANRTVTPGIVPAINIRNPSPISYASGGSSGLQTTTDSFQSAQNGLNRMNLIGPSTMDVVSNFQGDTFQEMQAAELTIADHLNDLTDGMLVTMFDVEQSKTSLESVQDAIDSMRYTFVGLFGALTALFLPFIMMAIAISVRRLSSWHGERVGSYTVPTMRATAAVIYILVFYICCLAGSFLFSSTMCRDMHEYMLQGTPESGYKGIVEVNLENTVFPVGRTGKTIGHSVAGMLTCPEGCILRQGTSEGCNNTNNLVSLFSITNDYNFTSHFVSTLTNLGQTSLDIDNSTFHMANTTSQLQTDLRVIVEVGNNTSSTNASGTSSALQELLRVLPSEDFSEGQSDIAKWAAVFEVVLVAVDAGDLSAAINAPSEEQAAVNLQLRSYIQEALIASLEVGPGVEEVVNATEVMDRGIMELDKMILQMMAAWSVSSDHFRQVEGVILDELSAIYAGVFGATRCDWIGASFTEITLSVLTMAEHYSSAGVVAALCCALLYLTLAVLLPAGRWFREKPLSVAVQVDNNMLLVDDIELQPAFHQFDDQHPSTTPATTEEHRRPHVNSHSNMKETRCNVKKMEVPDGRGKHITQIAQGGRPVAKRNEVDVTGTPERSQRQRPTVDARLISVRDTIHEDMGLERSSKFCSFESRGSFAFHGADEHAVYSGAFGLWSLSDNEESESGLPMPPNGDLQQSNSPISFCSDRDVSAPKDSDSFKYRL